MIQRTISTGQMEAVFFCDEGGTPSRTIVLLAGSGGGLFSARPYEIVPDKLVSKGYSVLDLAYFRWGRLPRRARRIPLEYFEHALSWLSDQPEVIPGQYALLGRSQGGQLALVLASRYPECRAVVAVVPSHVVFQGMGMPYLAGSWWTHGGTDLPFVPFAPVPWLLTGGLGALTGHLGYLYRASLRRSGRSGEAAIPVELIHGPVQLISATKDQIWPSEAMCEAIMSRLFAHKFPHHHEHVAIEGPHWPLAKRESWQAIYRFLGDHFPPYAS